MHMHALVPGLLAWSAFSSSPTDFPMSYYVAPDFCDVVLPRFYEDHLLSLHPMQCTHVRGMMRAAADAWTHNVPTAVFVEADNASRADLVVSAVLLEDPEALAVAHVGGTRQLRIRIDASRCWFTEAAFCDTVVGAWSWLAPALTVSVVGVVWPPLLYMGAYRPCLSCYNVELVFMHELGHVLGLGHADVGAQRRGCGGGVEAGWEAGVEAAAETAAEDAVMTARIRHHRRACLGRDDVDGARTLLAPASCDAPVWCYEGASTLGATRILVGTLYSVGVALGMLACKVGHAAPP